MDHALPAIAGPRRALVLLACALAGCFVDEPPSGGGTTTTTTTTTTGESETEACTPGQAGCACLPGKVCAPTLGCLDGLCGPPEVCGDGIKTKSEACDDGDLDDDDACPSTCQLATCGDAFTQAGVEECDDGNDLDGDGCNVDCRLSGRFLWEQTISGDSAGREFGRAVAIDGAGALTVAGAIRSATGGLDLWVGRFGPGGEPGWVYTADGGAMVDDVAEAVVVAADGAVIVGGQVGQLINNTRRSRGWLARLDGASGEVAWQATIAGTDPAVDDQIRAIALDGDGTAVLTGWLGNAGTGTDLLLARYLADGAPLWTREFQGSVDGGVERGFAVQIAADGRLVVCGDQDTAPMTRDALVALYSANGEPVWAQPFDGGAALTEVARACAVNDQGVVYAAINEGFDAIADYWLVIYNAAGEETVRQRLGVPELLDVADGIAVGGDGSIVIVGADGGTADNTRIMIRKLRASTDLLWSATGAGVGASLNEAFAVALAPNGEVVVTGGKTIAADDYAIWLARLTP